MEDQNRPPPVTGYPATAYPQSNTNPNGYSTAGTAYPYAAPPPLPPQANYYNPNPYPYARPYAAQRATFVRRLFSALIATVIIMGTALFIIWLVLRPRLPEFRVDSLTVSNLNISSSTSLITANWDVRFTVRNPNGKITLSYDYVEASVYYSSERLAETALPPFVQGTKNETAFRASLAAPAAYIPKWAVDGINSERSRGTVNFNVRILSRVRFKAGAWRARRRYLSVLCGDLKVGVTSNSAGGSLEGGSRQCRVGL